jgi:hypothetical protein
MKEWFFSILQKAEIYYSFLKEFWKQYYELSKI